MPKNILDVGNCDPDHGSICRLLQNNFDVNVVRTHGMDDAIAALGERTFDLILVNRLMDRDGASGLAIIERIKGDSEFGSTPVMMITNFAEHQEYAAAAGAEAGFGKAELGDAATLERLRPFLGT